MGNTVRFAKLGKPQLAFMQWLQATHPNIYRQAVPDESGMSGVMDSITNGFNSLMSNAGTLLNQYVAGKQQIDLLKINISRAKQGLPPISATGPSNAIASSDSSSGFLSAVPLWAWIGLAVGGTWLLLRKK
jgi:hypothetical protein